MLPDLGRAEVVITNYHAFQRRERLKLAKGTRALLRGRGAAPSTVETEGEMLRRVIAPLMGMKSLLMLNDEGHHCYREKVGVSEEEDLKGDDSQEAKKNTEAARVWISGIETVKTKIGNQPPRRRGNEGLPGVVGREQPDLAVAPREPGRNSSDSRGTSGDCVEAVELNGPTLGALRGRCLQVEVGFRERNWA